MDCGILSASLNALHVGYISALTTQIPSQLCQKRLLQPRRRKAAHWVVRMLRLQIIFINPSSTTNKSQRALNFASGHHPTLPHGFMKHTQRPEEPSISTK